MTDKVKSPILIFIILILVSLSLAAGAFYLLQKERSTNTALHKELEDVRQKYNTTEKELADSKKLVLDLQGKLKEAQSKLDNLGNELEQEKGEKEKLSQQVEQLKQDYIKQRETRSDLETKLTQSQVDMKALQERAKELEGRKAELEKKIQDLEAAAQQAKETAQAQEKGVELGTIVVNPEASPPQAPSAQAQDTQAEPAQKKAKTSSQEGKILVINKDYNFAVINLGSKDGVNIGDIFSVYRNNKYIGDVKIEKTHDSMSAAEFISADIKNKVREGDKVLAKTR